MAAVMRKKVREMRFIAHMNYGAKPEDDTFINIEADRMEHDETFVYVYRDGKLVAVVNLAVIAQCHLSEGR
jgi:hypothetical protein